MKDHRSINFKKNSNFIILLNFHGSTFEYKLKLLKSWQDAENELLISCAGIETKEKS